MVPKCRRSMSTLPRKGNEKRWYPIPENVYGIAGERVICLSSKRTENTVYDFPCMNEGVKFQMWAVQLAFSPNVNESFWARRALLLKLWLPRDRNGAGQGEFASGRFRREDPWALRF